MSSFTVLPIPQDTQKLHCVRIDGSVLQYFAGDAQQPQLTNERFVLEKCPPFTVLPIPQETTLCTYWWFGNARFHKRCSKASVGGDVDFLQQLVLEVLFTTNNFLPSLLFINESLFRAKRKEICVSQRINENYFFPMGLFFSVIKFF